MAKSAKTGVSSRELQLPVPLSVSLVFPSGLILLIFFLVPLSAFPLHVPSHRLNKCLPGDRLTGICLRGAITTEWRNLYPWLPR